MFGTKSNGAICLLPITTGPAIWLGLTGISSATDGCPTLFDRPSKAAQAAGSFRTRRPITFGFATTRASSSTRLLRMKPTSLFSGAAPGSCCFCFLLALATAPLWTAAAAVTFYVAPEGKDANPGTREQPYASFERAQQAVRAER